MSHPRKTGLVLGPQAGPQGRQREKVEILLQGRGSLLESASLQPGGPRCWTPHPEVRAGQGLKELMKCLWLSRPLGQAVHAKASVG